MNELWLLILTLVSILRILDMCVHFVFIYPPPPTSPIPTRKRSFLCAPRQGDGQWDKEMDKGRERIIHDMNECLGYVWNWMKRWMCQLSENARFLVINVCVFIFRGPYSYLCFSGKVLPPSTCVHTHTHRVLTLTQTCICIYSQLYKVLFFGQVKDFL